MPSGARQMYSRSAERQCVLRPASRMIGASAAYVARTCVATGTPADVDAPRAGSLVTELAASSRMGERMRWVSDLAAGRVWLTTFRRFIQCGLGDL